MDPAKVKVWLDLGWSLSCTLIMTSLAAFVASLSLIMAVRAVELFYEIRRNFR
jgi:hypothetical protein